MTAFRGIGAWRLVNGPLVRPWGQLGFTWVPTQYSGLDGLGYSVFEFGAGIGDPAAVTDPTYQEKDLRKWDSQRVACFCVCGVPGARALNSRQIKHLRQLSETTGIIGSRQGILSQPGFTPDRVFF